MNEADLEVALRARLTAITPTWKTKDPGIDLKRSATLAYQIATLMLARPENAAFGRGVFTRQEGVLQVDLYYPKSEKRTDILYARGALVRDAFYPANGRGGSISVAGGKCLILRRPHVPGSVDETDATHNRLTVDVFMTLEIPPA